jgi:uncharacterized damage-inducible protein DinB
MTDLEPLRFPVGRFVRFTGSQDSATRIARIKTIEDMPARFRSLLAGRSDAELDTPYRPGGWTVRQVVHHVPDSHLNAYIRMKFAVMEEAPSIKAYDEAHWAESPEARSGAVEMSLVLLDGLHRRWIAFLHSLSEAQFSRTYVHPEMGPVTLDEALALYAWHSRHHAGHIKLGLGIRD